MSMWIDVYPVGGGADIYPEARLGGGPILTATEWECPANLDGVGSFSFAMPASDPKAALLANRRVVFAYAFTANGSRIYAGSGIINRIDLEPGDVPTLRVSGPDLLQELAGRTVGQLDVKTQAWSYLSGGKGTVRSVASTTAGNEIDRTQAYDASLTTITGTIQVTDNWDAWWLYVGYDARFDKMRFTIGTPNTRATVLQWQYYSKEDGWQDLAVTDGTVVGGVPMAQLTPASALVEFTRPLDWERVKAIETSAGTWFYVRCRRQLGIGDNLEFTLKEVEVYADVATTGGVNLIMANAPAAWGVSAFPLTTSAHYVEYDGESVLNALLTLSEQGGQKP